jgi:hypothetical protein
MRRRLVRTLPVGLVALALLGCGSDDGGGGSPPPPSTGTAERHMRFTAVLTAGGEQRVDALSIVTLADTLQGCEGATRDGWGALVAWELGSPPDIGTYELTGSLSTFPQMMVVFPKLTGGYRMKFVVNGSVEVTDSGGGVIEGTFDGITFTVDDPDDRISAVNDGEFRCVGDI